MNRDKRLDELYLKRFTDKIKSFTKTAFQDASQTAVSPEVQNQQALYQQQQTQSNENMANEAYTMATELQGMADQLSGKLNVSENIFRIAGGSPFWPKANLVINTLQELSKLLTQVTNEFKENPTQQQDILQTTYNPEVAMTPDGLLQGFMGEG